MSDILTILSDEKLLAIFEMIATATEEQGVTALVFFW
jgi:hypothetical protein